MVLALAGHRGVLVRWLPLIVYREIKFSKLQCVMNISHHSAHASDFCGNELTVPAHKYSHHAQLTSCQEG